MKKLILMATLALGLGAGSVLAQNPTYTHTAKDTVVYTTLDKQSGMDVASEYKVTDDSIILKSMYLVEGDSPTKFAMNRDVTNTLKPSIKDELYKAVKEPIAKDAASADKKSDHKKSKLTKEKSKKAALKQSKSKKASVDKNKKAQKRYAKANKKDK